MVILSQWYHTSVIYINGFHQIRYTILYNSSCFMVICHTITQSNTQSQSARQSSAIAATHETHTQRRECQQNVLQNPICVHASSFARARFLTPPSRMSRTRENVRSSADRTSLLCKIWPVRIFARSASPTTGSTGTSAIAFVCSPARSLARPCAFSTSIATHWRIVLRAGLVRNRILLWDHNHLI